MKTPPRSKLYMNQYIVTISQNNKITVSESTDHSENLVNTPFQTASATYHAVFISHISFFSSASQYTFQPVPVTASQEKYHWMEAHRKWKLPFLSEMESDHMAMLSKNPEKRQAIQRQVSICTHVYHDHAFFHSAQESQAWWLVDRSASIPVWTMIWLRIIRSWRSERKLL